MKNESENLRAFKEKSLGLVVAILGIPSLSCAGIDFLIHGELTAAGEVAVGTSLILGAFYGASEYMIRKGWI